jgi:H+/Cl- antiporter ClcA
MPLRWDLREHLRQGRFFLRWLALAGPLGAVVGSAVALFLWSLDAVTALRWTTVVPASPRGLPWLLYLLPLAGVGSAILYRAAGKSADRGNNLIIDEIHSPGGGAGGTGPGVPARMAPLVLVGTLITHLFGGSAGREGTAVQMGGSLAAAAARLLRLKPHDVRLLLTAGVAAGFGAVFGTPLAGAVFAVEVLAIGNIRYDAILPCLVAAIVGDQVCAAWGIHHTAYAIPSLSGLHIAYPLDWRLALKVAVAAVAFGLASVLFAELAHSVSAACKRIKWPLLRPAIGGVAVIALAWLVGRDYLGLGVTSPFPEDVTIVSAFSPGGATAWSWLWKIILTAVTVGSGFKGGEVTPLFFVGATLGNALARGLGAPADLFAGLGFVAVFAGATNTPLACTIMGVELFGSGPLVYVAMACFVAYLFSGHNGIYLAQRIGVAKSGEDPAADAPGTLADRRVARPPLAAVFARLFARRRASR